MSVSPQADTAALTVRLRERDRAARALGIDTEITAPGRARATMTVTEAMLNGHGICHGGLIFTLADTAFAYACNSYGPTTVAARAGIDFLAPAHRGDVLTASAVERARGGRSGVYDVSVSNQHDEVIALFRGNSHQLRQG